MLACVAAFLWLLQDPRTLQVRSPVAASDPDFPDYAASLLGASVTNGDTFDVLQNGDAIFAAMLQAVEGAHRRISFESFIYSDGDDQRSASRRRSWPRPAAASTFASCSMATAPTISRRNRLPSSKPRACGSCGSTGCARGRSTASTTARIARCSSSTARWRSPAASASPITGAAPRRIPITGVTRRCSVRGPAVRALEASFYENWIESGGAEAPRLDPEPAEQRQRHAWRRAAIVAWSNFSGGASNVKLLYLLSIAAARRTIDIQSPYIVLDSSLRWSLAQARASRRARASADRRRSHRRRAGEGGQPRRL